MKKKVNYFKEIRKEHGLTQNCMAEKLGISYSHYTKLETGYVKPSYQLLERIKLTFGEVDINNFFK